MSLYWASLTVLASQTLKGNTTGLTERQEWWRTALPWTGLSYRARLAAVKWQHLSCWVTGCPSSLRLWLHYVQLVLIYTRSITVLLRSPRGVCPWRCPWLGPTELSSLPWCNQKLETPVCFPRTVLAIRVAYGGRGRRFHVGERGCRECGLRQLSRESS